MQFHPQFLIDLQFTNMSTQMSSAHKHDFEDQIINKHQFCNHCKFDGGYMVHNNCAPFLCEYCGYLRNYTHHSDQHLKTQPPMKPFSCNYCGYSTDRAYNLNRHLKIHNTTMIKPFTCTVCNYSSNNKCNFIRHLKRIHNKTIIKQFACNYCEFSTDRAYNLNQHLKKVHHITPTPPIFRVGG